MVMKSKIWSKSTKMHYPKKFNLTNVNYELIIFNF
jgi:hypothetical protein